MQYEVELRDSAHGRTAAYLDNELLAASRTPFADAARVLRERGARGTDAAIFTRDSRPVGQHHIAALAPQVSASWRLSGNSAAL